MTQNSGVGARVFIETYGCQMNVYDTAAIFGVLAEAGFRRATSPEEAEVILLNTCSVREHAEHRVLSRVGELRRRLITSGPKLPVIGLCGCMAERLGEQLVENGRAPDLAVGVDRYDRLAPLLTEILRDRKIPGRVAVGHRPDAHYVAPPEAYPQNNSHLVTIHKGCDYRCTYCVVPDTRGPQREKAPEAILDEIRQIVGRGGAEVTLLGQNVTAYHWLPDLDFARLLRRLAAVAGLERIRFLTGHPRDMTDPLLDLIANEPKVCPWLHVPMQSGSDRVLKRMKRLYTRDEYLAMVTKARAWIPGVAFSSDFIVGFPGETEEDFRLTLEALREVQYDQVFSFKYSARPGTPAARLPDDVPLAEKKRRLAKLMSVQTKIWEGIAASQIGKTWRGWVEGPARRPAGSWRARTVNNRKVLLAGDGLRLGAEVEFRVTGFEHSTFRGELLRGPR